MKIKRYTAPDMRQALNLVRAELGPDAVILSSRRGDGQVEVTVAADTDLEALSDVAEQAAAAVATPRRQGTAETNAAHTPGPQAGSRHGSDGPAAAPGFAALLEQRRRLETATAPAPNGEPAAAAGAAGGVASAEINGELQTLRRMLETQLAALAWNDLTRRAPLATELLRELTRIGFAQDVVARVADALPAALDFTRARRLAIARLADGLQVTGDRWAEFGGVVAFVGPAGAGKTTALGRLAARWVMRHGPRAIALVSTDTRRFGAHEQVRRIGRLLGAATYAVDEPEHLPGLVQRLGEQRLVLLDTAGTSVRDPQFVPLLERLRAVHPRIEFALTLSAATQAGAVEELVARCSGHGTVAGVITKIEECASFGGALSAFMRARLPLAYLSEGEDLGDGLRPARALDLVCMAVQLADRNGAAADEDMLSRRFGGRFHAAS